MTSPQADASAGRITLFWSGDLGQQVAEFHSKLLSAVFGVERVFISTQIDVGTRWMGKLTNEIAKAPIGIFFLTPDSLESRWMPIELGMFLATHEGERVLPVRVTVGQRLVEARVPVLRERNTQEFGTLASFVSLCRVCADALSPDLAASTKQAAEETWQQHVGEADQLLARAKAFLPDNYDGTTRFSMSVDKSNFQMPGVFSAFERDLFLVGVNHAFVLNTESDSSVMLALLERLLTGPSGKARFMISDVWRPAILECYAGLVVSPGFAQREAAAFNRIYKSPEAPSYIGKLIEKNFGADGLRRVIEERLLQIRLWPSILDTLWFVDGKRGQFTLAVAQGGPHRPHVYCGSGPDEAPEVLTYYLKLANTAYGGAPVLWPPESA